YSLVERVYLLMEGISNADDSLLTPEERNAYIAEAVFFRAWAYRHLVSFFGDGPMVKEAIDFAKTYFVRDPICAAYQQMERDLSFAVQYLPNPGAEKEPGRITKGAAYHLLTEVYLMQHKYTEAVTAATHVINDFGYRLMTERF